VLRSPAGRTGWEVEHHGHVDLSTRHVGQLGTLLKYLIHGGEDKITVLEINDGPHAPDRGSDPEPHEPGLRNRGVDDSLGPEPIEQAQGEEKGSTYPDVFAHDEDIGVALHLLADRLPEGLNDRQVAGSALGDRPGRIRR